MRHLITGGAGFIGSHLADALVARGDEVLILDDFSTGRRENVEGLLRSPGVQLVEGSVLDAELVTECMRSVDKCFHLACAVGVQLIIRQPLQSLLRNVRGDDVVMATAARFRTPLLFTSTSEIYGRSSDSAMDESADRLMGSPFKSRWAYANTKAFGETLAYSYYREVETPMVVARLFNTVGPRQSGAYGMVLPRFVRQALANEELTVYGNGAQTRCFVHVLDTVEALVLLGDSELAYGNVYNVGSTTEVPIVELARRVIEHVGSESGIRLVPYEDAYGEDFEELGRRVPDTGRLRQLTGWTPTRSIDDAIDDVAAHERRAPALGGNTSAA